MRTFLIALTLSSFCPVLLTAQICSETDCMGVYFDREATQSDLYTTGVMQPVSAYLCISNPSESAGVAGWECELEVDGAVVAPSWIYTNNGLNISDGIGEGLFNVGVGFGSEAIPVMNNVALLATWSAFIPSSSTEVRFYLRRFPGSITFDETPGYVSGADVNTIYSCFIHMSNIVTDYSAQINVPDTRINEDATWSEVKSLYQR